MTGHANPVYNWVSNPSGTTLETFFAFAAFRWKLGAQLFNTRVHWELSKKGQGDHG